MPSSLHDLHAEQCDVLERACALPFLLRLHLLQVSFLQTIFPLLVYREWTSPKPIALQLLLEHACILSLPNSSGGHKSLAGAMQEGGLAIEFDEPIAALFRVGMIVTATFQRLSDGSNSRWELSSPGYCWPSWCCMQGCLSKFAARRSRA